MATRMEIRERRPVNILAKIIVGLISFLCLIPFILVVSGSFSSEDLVLVNGYKLWPQGFSLSAYETILRSPENIFFAYRSTVIYTFFGTALGLFLTAMTGYVLNRKDFAWRNIFSYFFYFTTLFSGGLVPTYILMIRMGFKNSGLAIILPGLLSVFNILIMRNFANSIPDAITESAKIDGANDFVIFIRLVLPLLKPALATVGLFLALAYWNEWYNCMLYISDRTKFTLQFYLYNLLNSQEEIQRMASRGVSLNISYYTQPTETMKLAMTCVVTGPIVLLYPFVQRYFVKGITIGAVKG